MVTVVVVLGILLAPLNNGRGRPCNTSTIVALDPGYFDGEFGGYPDGDHTSCHRAALPRGFTALGIAVAGGLGTAWAIRRRTDPPVP